MKYRQKIEVEAFQLTVENAKRVSDWCNGAYWSECAESSIPSVYVNTSDDKEEFVQARIGDYIVCDNFGDFHVVKPEIFAKTYEQIDSGEMNHLGETKHPGIINIPDELKGKKQSWSFSEKPGFAIVNFGGRNYQVDENNDVHEVKTSMKKLLQ